MRLNKKLSATALAYVLALLVLTACGGGGGGGISASGSGSVTLNPGYSSTTGTTIPTGSSTPSTSIKDVTISSATFPDSAFRAYVSTNFDKNSDGVLSVSEIKAAQIIDVSNKNISDLTGIEYFTELLQLKCNNNNLAKLDVSKNTKLMDLDCSQNNLTTLDVSKNTELILLQCYVNQLKSLNVSKNAKLEGLCCGGNSNLKSLDLSNNTSLTELNCLSTGITSVDVSKTKITESDGTLKVDSAVKVTYAGGTATPTEPSSSSSEVPTTAEYIATATLTDTTTYNSSRTAAYFSHKDFYVEGTYLWVVNSEIWSENVTEVQNAKINGKTFEYERYTIGQIDRIYWNYDVGYEIDLPESSATRYGNLTWNHYFSIPQDAAAKYSVTTGTAQIDGVEYYCELVHVGDGVDADSGERIYCFSKSGMTLKYILAVSNSKTVDGKTYVYNAFKVNKAEKTSDSLDPQSFLPANFPASFSVNNRDGYNSFTNFHY